VVGKDPKSGGGDRLRACTYVSVSVARPQVCIITDNVCYVKTAIDCRDLNTIQCQSMPHDSTSLSKPFILVPLIRYAFGQQDAVAHLGILVKASALLSTCDHDLSLN
jgi:hypothetical protein